MKSKTGFLATQLRLLTLQINVVTHWKNEVYILIN